MSFSFRGVVAIVTGTAAAQALGVIVSPLLTRLYTPEAMGIWGMFVSFLGVATVAATLRYEMAIVAARRERDAIRLTQASLLLGVLTALLGAVAIEVLRRTNVMGYGVLDTWVSFLVFPALLGTAWGTVLRYYSTRLGLFELVGTSVAIQGLTRTLAQLFLFPLSWAGLLVGEVLSRFLALITFRRVLPAASGFPLCLNILSKYRMYPLVYVPSGLLDTLALMAPVPIFVALFGPAVGGSLALAQRVIAVPLNLVGTAVADVFYSRASELARTRPEALRSFLKVTMFKLSLVAVPLGFLLWLVVPGIVPWVFGSEWRDTGKFVAALAPWLSAQLVVSPVSRVVFLSRYGWLKLMYDTISVLVVSLPLFLSSKSAVNALSLVSWLKTAQLLLYAVLVVYLSRPTFLVDYFEGVKDVEKKAG